MRLSLLSWCPLKDIRNTWEDWRSCLKFVRNQWEEKFLNGGQYPSTSSSEFLCHSCLEFSPLVSLHLVHINKYTQVLVSFAFSWYNMNRIVPRFVKWLVINFISGRRTTNQHEEAVWEQVDDGLHGDVVAVHRDHGLLSLSLAPDSWSSWEISDSAGRWFCTHVSIYLQVHNYWVVTWSSNLHHADTSTQTQTIPAKFMLKRRTAVSLVRLEYQILNPTPARQLTGWRGASVSRRVLPGYQLTWDHGPG